MSAHDQLRVHLIGWTTFDAMLAHDLTGWRVDDDTPMDGGQALAEFAGRACYQSWTKPNPATATNAGYLSHILDVGHLSVLEHGTATMYLTGVSRSLTHELVRHRHFSYSQLSQRYVTGAEPVEPDIIAGDPYLHGVFMRAWNATQEAYAELLHGLERTFEPRCPDCDGPVRRENDPCGWWCARCTRLHRYPAGAHQPEPVPPFVAAFEAQAVKGAPRCAVCSEPWPCTSSRLASTTSARKQARQAARAVLPNATETRIVVTGNYRAWRHFITMRATEHADVEIRELAVRCLGELHRVAPNVFADFTTFNLPDGTLAARTPHQVES